VTYNELFSAAENRNLIVCLSSDRLGLRRTPQASYTASVPIRDLKIPTLNEAANELAKRMRW
jgi:hypothetical protein